MRLTALPYILGAFVFLPLAIWSGLWLTAFGGPKLGFEEPLANALLAVSIPLVLWFLISSVATIANSMAGASALLAPRFSLARWIVQLLPVATVVLGTLSAIYLGVVDGPSLAVALPLAMALLFAFAIRKGEERRANDAGAPLAKPGLRARLRPVTDTITSVLARVTFAVPIAGWMVRDATQGRTSARRYFAFNLVVVWLVALWWLGPVLVLWTALAGTVLVFGGLIALTATR